MASVNTIDVDTSLWPVVVCTPRGNLSDKEYQQMFAAFDELWRRGQKFVTITDTRFNDTATARQRQLIGEWVKKNGPTIQRHSLGSVLIVESAIVRGALTAISWVSQADFSSSYVKNWEQATSATLALLEKAGQPTTGLRERLLAFATVNRAS